MLEQLLLLLDQLPHLLDEVRLDVRAGVQRLGRGALAQGLVHDELALAGRLLQEIHEVRQGPSWKSLAKPRPYRPISRERIAFWKRFLVRLPDAHDLADGPHLRSQLVLHPLELLEGPAGELHHHVVPRRRVLLQRAVAPVRDLVQREPARQEGRDERDGEPGGLAGQGRGPGGARIDLDDHHPAGLRVVGKLDVGPADDLDGVHDVVGVPLQALLQLRRDGQHRRGAVRVPGVHPHGVHVLDEADRDLLPLGVAHDLQLQLLPPEDRLLDEDLADQAHGQTAADDGLELFHVVGEAAARPPQGVRGTDDHREADPLHDRLCLFHGCGRSRSWACRCRAAAMVVLELLPVLAALDGVHVDADHLHSVLLQNAFAGERRGEVEPRLAAQVRQQGVGPLLAR